MRVEARANTCAKNPGGALRTSPFDDEDGTFYALVNSELQYSLWPAFATVPDGWHVVHGGSGGASRESCMEFIEANWTDMRPRSLQDAMNGDVAAR
jgi:MbtH protein